MEEMTTTQALANLVALDRRITERYNEIHALAEKFARDANNAVNCMESASSDEAFFMYGNQLYKLGRGSARKWYLEKVPFTGEAHDE